MNVVILAAGMGTRLGRPHPKPLTRLADGRSMLRRQIDAVRGVLGRHTSILVVVGFKMSQIMESCCAEVCFVYNELYDQTNTSQSLRRALALAPPGGVLWLNADVVFAPEVLRILEPHLAEQRSFVAVNRRPIGTEEVGYTLDGDGFVARLSKRLPEGLGEAVGINYVAAADRRVLQCHLDRCAEHDYFERGLQLAIRESGLRVRAVDIGGLGCVEVDTPADLDRANQVVTGAAGSSAVQTLRPAVPAGGPGPVARM